MTLNAVLLNAAHDLEGLTPWVLTSEVAPRWAGWYKTRVISSPELLQPQRRYWDGLHWSVPAIVGVTRDEIAEERKLIGTWRENCQIEWCGLKHPYLGHSIA